MGVPPAIFWRGFQLHVVKPKLAFRTGGLVLWPCPGGILPSLGYIGKYSLKGNGFSAALVKKIIWYRFGHFGLKRVWFLYSSIKLGMFSRRSCFFIIIDKTQNKSPSKIMFRATVSAATVINRASYSWSGHK